MSENIETAKRLSTLPDHQGEHYISLLTRLHQILRPKTYLEVGVFQGDTLRLPKCRSIAIDPQFRIHEGRHLAEILMKPELHLFQMPSDDYFRSQSPSALLGAPIDIAFLDGMHRCEFLLRDFLNVEQHCRPNSLIVLHDCLPLDLEMTSRLPFGGKSDGRNWWTGDVWRAALLLKRQRPKLRVSAFDAVPTGLVIITNLDPEDRSLASTYQECAEAMLSWDLADIGLENLYSELEVEPTSSLAVEDKITGRYWL